ncbi:MAG: hypothetical protein ACI8TQ_000269 [Planctomycetota bacterium]|jgi:hypothetical protein
MFSKNVLASILAVASLSTASAQNLDPRGIYFNRFTGSFNGTEYFQITPINGSTTNFRIADLYGGGFTGTIDGFGNISIPNTNPPGSFSDPDNFIIFPFNGQFTFDSNRVPTTTVDFPLTLDSPQTANSLLAGQWSNTLRFINPETGQLGAPGTEIITVDLDGPRVKITDPGGAFFQGIFENGLQAGFRVLQNPTFPVPTGDFAAFPGPGTNTGQDVLGELSMININQFRASFLLQTRTALGNQSQSLVEFEATRLNPLAVGDANGDGFVDGLDEAIVDSLQGLSFEDGNYNLAADVNADGLINGTDLELYRGKFTDLGNQLVGDFAPTFSASGSLAPGASFALSFSNMPESTTAFAFFGTTAINVPFFGGTLVPSGTTLVKFPTPAISTNTFVINASLAPGLPTGTQIYGQAWFADPGGVQGASATNALLLETP